MSLADANQSGLDTALQSLQSSPNGGKHISTVVDVRDSKQVNNWIEKTVSDHGRLDGAVNLAGVFKLCTLKEETDEGWDFTMDINAKGVFYCLRAQLNNMKEGGSIVSAAFLSFSAISCLLLIPFLASHLRACLNCLGVLN